MNLIEILIYTIGSVFFIFLLLFAYYSLKCAKLMQGSKGRQLIAVSVMLFIVASVIGAVDAFFFPGSGLHLITFFLWMVALLTLIYGGLSVGKAIQKVYPSSLLKIAWHHPGSIYNLIGISMLVFWGIPLYLLDILRPISGDFSWFSVFSVALWAFCFANLALAARIHCLSGVKSGREPEELILLRDDILVTKAYGTLINTFLASTNPMAWLFKETLIEYFEYNPILFEGCKFKQDGTIDFEPVVGNIDRLHGENRVQEICTIFSHLSSKLLGLYGAMTSPKHAEDILAESYRATREVYKDSVIFFDILRSLPGGVLEEERIRLLPREELEARIRKRTHELEEARSYIDNIIESMINSLIVVDPDGKIRTINKATEKLLGYDKDELIGQPIDVVFSEDELEFKGSKMEDLIKQEPLQNVEETYLSKDGRKIPVLFSGSFMYDPDVQIQGIVCMAQDITERKRAAEKIKASLAEKEVLLREIHHRVKNNLQVISSLIDMSIMRTKNQESIDFGKEIYARIQAMALIHSQLYLSDNFNEINMQSHIRQLVSFLSQIYETRERLVKSIIGQSDVTLSITQAIPCAVVLNELISNAFKHAFKDREAGTIEISINRSEDEKVLITIKDDGIGIPEDIDIGSLNSLGLKLVKNLVEAQLRGNMQLERNNGTEFIIEFPILRD